MNLKTQHFPILALFLISIPFIKAIDQACVPQQIHLSFGDKYHSVSTASTDADNQAYLVWLAKDHCKYSVDITEAKDLKLNKQKVDVSVTQSYSHDFAEDLDGEFPGSYQKTSYTVLFQNLLNDTLYQYKILDSDGQSLAGPFTFSLASHEITTKPKKIIFFGNTNNSTSGNLTLEQIRSKVLKTPEDYAALVNLGSNLYQIQDANGTKGDQFYESIESLTRSIPLISSPGANDSFDEWNFFNFRTRNPLYKQTQNQYFSFNLEGVHFISINFDYYFTNSSTEKTVFSWIEKDLTQANDAKNRAIYPWIVVIAQNPIYCSQNTADMTEANKCYNQYNKMKNFDELFHKYSVDLMISGGPNSYERMSPIYQNQSSKYTETPNDSRKTNIKDANGTVYIVENVAATKEGGNTQYKAQQKYGLFVDQRAGYGTLTSMKDATGDFKLVYEHYNSQNGQVIDTMNLVKTNTFIKHKNKTPYLLMVLGMAFGVVLVTVGLIALRRMKQNNEAEDNIPLTGETNPHGNSPMRSNRLRYARPGEKGITMVDLVLC